MISSALPNYREMVESYTAGVTSGEIVAGKLVRQAVARHVRDLKEAGERGWIFDAEAANRACLFFPMCLRHSIGEWAGQPFMLSPWQAFITWVLFGWKNWQTKTRRFRKAYLSVARKNGKTTWVAGLALKSLFCDEPPGTIAQPEPGGMVFCAATKLDQAKLLFDEAVRMIDQSEWLKELCKIRKAPHPRIEYTANDGYFRPVVTSDNLSGLHPIGVFLDELHEWREHHRAPKAALESGSGARRQPLEVIITTAGDSSSQIWIEEDKYAAECVEFAERGEVYDDQYFSFVARIDDDDDPLDEKNWGKSNPNLGISVNVDFLRSEATAARNSAPSMNRFVRFYANQQTEASERAISVSAWDKGRKPLTLAPGDVCHGGMDLGRTNDWAAAALCFPRYTEADGELRATSWELLVKCWTCSDGKFDVRKEPFASWMRRGLLGVCRGNCIDFEVVEQQFHEWSGLYSIQTIAFDKTFARETAKRMQDAYGFPMFEFTQSHRFYNEPMRRLIETELPNGNIIHGGDEVLTWQAGNVQVSRNAKGEWMPDKSSDKVKIDGMVAALMAFSECLFAAQQSWTTGPLQSG